MTVVERAKGKIRFAFKTPIKEMMKSPKKDSLIMLHFSYGKMRFKYSTGYFSCYNDWDFQKQRLKNKANILNRGSVNDFLNTLETELYKEVSSRESRQQTIEKEPLKRRLDELTNKRTPQNEELRRPSLYQYYDHFLDIRKGKLKKITIRSYKQTKKLLERYNTNLDFDDIDIKFYYGFIEFLEEDEKSLNTIGKHIKNLRSILNSATQEGVNTNLSYTNRDFKVLREPSSSIFLSADEIQKMAAYDLNAYPNLELARDIFLIGCYTGQRVSDYNGLTLDQVVVLKKDGQEVEFFKIKQKKTGKEVLCPITLEIREIMKKTRYNNAPPPKLNEQDINEYIKIVGQKCGIDQNETRSYTKGGVLVKEKVPKYKLITTHTARRSFCTNQYLKKMPLRKIMYFSGHSTEKEFSNYLKIKTKQEALEIALEGYFNL